MLAVDVDVERQPARCFGIDLARVERETQELLKQANREEE